MFGALRTIGTVLTVAAGTKFGKQQYDKYRDAKRKRQVEEVHEFLKNIDLEQLQKAVAANDVELLVDAVESILSAAHDVREKTEAEEIREDLSAAAKGVTDKFKSFFDELKNSDDFKKAAESFTTGVDKAAAKLDEAMESVGESFESVTENLSGIIDEVTAEIEREAAEAKAAEEAAEQGANDEDNIPEKKKDPIEELAQKMAEGFGPAFAAIFANDETPDPKVKQPPTFDEFMQGASLTVKLDNGITQIVNIKSEDVMVNPSKKMVVVERAQITLK